MPFFFTVLIVSWSASRLSLAADAENLEQFSRP